MANTESGSPVMKATAIVLVLLGVALVGCGSGDDSSTVPTSATSSTVPATPTTGSSAPNEHPAVSPISVTPASPTSSLDAAQTESAVDHPIEEILADRVRAYFAARLVANAAPAPNPDDPGLAEVASGRELEALVENTRTRLDAGQALRPGDEGLGEVRVGSVEVDGATASVAACSIDDEVIFDVATGEVVNDEVVTHNYTIGLELRGDVWKVTEIVRIQQREGVGGCALASGDFPF
jgi:hypothetical protein